MRIQRQGVVLLQFCVLGWLGVDLSALSPPDSLEIDRALDDALAFESPDDLTIEGQGIGRPYWNDDQPAWTAAFDVAAERQRIDLIRRAAFQHAQRGGSLLTM